MRRARLFPPERCHCLSRLPPTGAGTSCRQNTPFFLPSAPSCPIPPEEASLRLARACAHRRHAVLTRERYSAYTPRYYAYHAIYYQLYLSRMAHARRHHTAAATRSAPVRATLMIAASAAPRSHWCAAVITAHARAAYRRVTFNIRSVYTTTNDATRPPPRTYAYYARSPRVTPAVRPPTATDTPRCWFAAIGVAAPLRRAAAARHSTLRAFRVTRRLLDERR